MNKILRVLIRKGIGCLDGLNNRIFTTMYYLFLKQQGVKFSGRPNYIASSAYLDGQGLSLISIGKDVVISREVMLLTHDYSIETALHSQGVGTDNRTIHLNKQISIGDNTFIGARASILPGSNIGKNCIVGACCVIKGTINDNLIVIGNPSRIIGTTEQLAKRYTEMNA